MLNRFRNALYGTSGSTDDSSVCADNEDLIGKKIQGALTRSSSFREDLLSESARSRAGVVQQSTTSNNNSTSNLLGSLHRGKSQLLRRSTSAIAEEDEGSAGSSQYSKSSQSTTPSSSSSNQRRARVVTGGSGSGSRTMVPKFHYTRPEFLQLRTDDEIIVSADHQIRPIILPRDVARLPWFSGYGECINAGKSLKNEDQAACYQDVAIRQSTLQGTSSDSIRDQIPWTYFGMFDGHAGTAVAIAAAAQLHNIISEKFRQVADLLIALEFDLEDRDEGEDHEADGDEGELLEEDEFADCQSSPQLSGNSVSVVENSPEESASAEAEVKHETGDSKEVDGDKKSSGCSEVKNENKQQGPTAQVSTVDNVKVANGSNKQTRARAQTVHSRPQAQSATTSNEPVNEVSLLPSMIDICRNNVTVDSLITGALESAFWEMDGIIASDKLQYKMAGGCTALASVFILGKLYVCNAGDSRAIVVRSGCGGSGGGGGNDNGSQVVPMSFDFTPTSERERILRLGMARPEFLGNEFTHLEFLKRPTRKDLGKQMLYRDAYMSGWSMKTITYDDLRFPLVWGEGKRSRVLATIGVTRGFGDHELRAQYGSVLIKPFLTPEPQVRVLPLVDEQVLGSSSLDNKHKDSQQQRRQQQQQQQQQEITAEDVLIMGTDGLWDVTSNEEVGEIIRRSFDLFPDSLNTNNTTSTTAANTSDESTAGSESRSKYRYIWAAQDLVIHSRGLASQWNNVWRTSDDRLASLDDISVFVVPLKPYRDEYLEWRKLRNECRRGGRFGPTRQRRSDKVEQQRG